MQKKWLQLDLARCDYLSAMQWQENILAAVIAGQGESTLILMEHEPVFTLGNRSDPANLKVDLGFLAAQNIELVQTRRGGDITYHGPGQLVAYPIISLPELKLSIPDYISRLEEVMIQTAEKFQIKAERSGKNRGVWSGGKKLGSVGISLKRRISYHGLALNADLELAPFSWINPCGLTGIKVTSLAEEAGRKISLPEVKTALLAAFNKVFQVSFQPCQASWRGGKADGLDRGGPDAEAVSPPAISA
jgi:lipoate-protein ligase B